MHHDDGDFLGIVGLEEIEARLLGETLGDKDVLDAEVIEFAHIPEKVDRCGPVRREVVAVFPDR